MSKKRFVKVNKYLYSVSCGCYSNYEEVILVHPKKFCPEAFQDMCVSASLSVAQQEVFSMDQFDKIVEKMVEIYSFEIVKPLNCHLFDYSLPGRSGKFLKEIKSNSDDFEQYFVIDGLEKRFREKHK